MSNIVYTNDLTDITAEKLSGFFVGWSTPPSAETLFDLLSRSDHRILAIDEASSAVIGYVTALSDGVLFGYISSLEVLPSYKGCGIGTQLVTRMLAELANLYAIDVVCDPEVRPFYEHCGLRPCSAMIIRRYDKLMPKGDSL